MSNATQQNYEFQVGDGADPEVFAKLPELDEVPEIAFQNPTTRANRKVGDSSTVITHCFNKLEEGAEFALPCDFIPGNTLQDRVRGLVKNDDGINCKFVLTGTTHTYTASFNCLVVSAPITGSPPNDADSKNMVTFNMRINGDVTVVQAAI